MLETAKKIFVTLRGDMREGKTSQSTKLRAAERASHRSSKENPNSDGNLDLRC